MNTVYFHIIKIIIIILLPLKSLSQEICNNGIDDDSDELIDFNDSNECNCQSTFAVTSTANLVCTEIETLIL